MGAEKALAWQSTLIHASCPPASSLRIATLAPWAVRPSFRHQLRIVEGASRSSRVKWITLPARRKSFD